MVTVMLANLLPPDDVDALLAKGNVIAVIGLSHKEDRPSNQVSQYLLAAGFTVIPINPGRAEILGQKCYPSLQAVPIKVDVVNIFRRSEDVPPIVDEAIRIGAKAIWMQLGIANEDAAQKARAAGLKVIMDRCIKIEHMQLSSRHI